MKTSELIIVNKEPQGNFFRTVKLVEIIEVDKEKLTACVKDTLSYFGMPYDKKDYEISVNHSFGNIYEVEVDTKENFIELFQCDELLRQKVLSALKEVEKHFNDEIKLGFPIYYYHK